MGPAFLPAFLMMLWGWEMWGLAPPAQAILPPNQNMTEMNQMFKEFMIRFNKTYLSQEEMHHRFEVFVQNLEVSRALQASELGTAEYGVTMFSDLTESEFGRMLGGSPFPSPPPVQKQKLKPLKGLYQRSCDWRKLGAITAVKHQLQRCRSCWAFAAVSNIEALWNIHYHSPQNLSVQEVLDCVRGGHGCVGGYAWDAFLTVMERGGLVKDADYLPYDGREHPCGRRQTAAAWIQDFVVLPRDEKEIAAVVASYGPVTATIYAKPFQHYTGGVIRRKVCAGRTNWPDHVVLILGYGEEEKKRGYPADKFWILKNSWGASWGEKGYFRLHRGSNACSVAKFPVTAIVTEAGLRPGAKVLCPK